MAEKIAGRQAICILILFIFGSTLILGVNSDLGQDSWFAQFLSAVMSIPVVMIYARVIKLFPEKDLIDIFNEVFGKVRAIPLILLMTWYSLHLGALVIINCSTFLKIVTMPETPTLPIMIIIIIVAAYIAKSGILTLGKWSVLIIPIPFFVAFLTSALSLKTIDLSNMYPVFEHNAAEFFASSYKTLTFPYAETVVFLFAADSLDKNENPYKIYFLGILVSTIVLLIIVIRNIGLMGPALM
jgi:spore germination protein KB